MVGAIDDGIRALGGRERNTAGDAQRNVQVDADRPPPPRIRPDMAGKRVAPLCTQLSPGLERRSWQVVGPLVWWVVFREGIIEGPARERAGLRGTERVTCELSGLALSCPCCPRPISANLEVFFSLPSVPPSPSRPPSRLFPCWCRLAATAQIAQDAVHEGRR